ncbi:MAG: 1-phosphofructokinase [Erysipelotrichaceae bacterium]
MIYTITCNPSLDYVMKVDSFKLGETNRSYDEHLYPGGKGFNVSMILHSLQVDTVALGFIAGFTGEEIKRQLVMREIKHDLCELDEGVSRINVKLKGECESEINGSGPLILDEQMDQLYSKLCELSSGDFLVLAGSLPPSLPKDTYSRIMNYLSKKNIKIIVDTTNESLRLVLAYHPFLVKPNQTELAELYHVRLNNIEDIIHYAKYLQREGALNVLVSMGKDGALLVCEDHHVYFCGSAKGSLINSVGSGDSMVAGFIAAYQKWGNYQEALLLASACGGATAFSEDLAEYELIQKLYGQLKCKELE